MAADSAHVISASYALDCALKPSIYGVSIGHQSGIWPAGRGLLARFAAQCPWWEAHLHLFTHESCEATRLLAAVMSACVMHRGGAAKRRSCDSAKR